MATQYRQIARVNTLAELATKRQVDAPQFLYGLSIFTWSPIAVDSSVPAADGGFWVSPVSNKVNFISKLSDLPAPSGGIITLAADTTYFFINSVNLGANRIVCGTNVTLAGISFTSVIISATLAATQSLITATSSFVAYNIGFSSTVAGTFVFNLDAGGSATSRLLFREVSASSSGIGTIKGYGTILLTSVGFLDIKAPLIIDGVCGLVQLDTMRFLNATAATTSLSYPATYNSTIRTEHFDCLFDTVATSTAINANPAITIVRNNFFIIDCLFTGAGTSLAGLTVADNKVFSRGNDGLASSFSGANYFMVGNATATVIGVVNTYVKVAGTTTAIAANTQRFSTAVTNRATFTGTITRRYRLTCNATMTAGNAQNLGLALFKNGVLIAESESSTTTTGAGQASSQISFAITELATNDFIEVFVKNITAATNITVSILNVAVTTVE
jgi:hypothetical protein